MHGKVHTTQGKGVFAPGAVTSYDGGFYVFRPAMGPTPGKWMWVAGKEKT
jgi:hypothetical protein